MTTSTLSETGRLVAANGAELYVRETGDGHPLILLHGGMFTGEFWNAMLPDFGTGLRLITVDSRGHGRSTNPADRLSYRQMADDIAGCIEALELDRPSVCGYSDGGKICLELACHHSGLVGSLVVGADRLTFDDAYITAVRQMALIGADDKPDIEKFESSYPEQCAAFAEWHGGVYGPTHWRTLLEWSVEMYLQPFDITTELLSKCEVPVLLLCGDRDETFPPEESLLLYRALPKGELAVLPNANHFFPYFHPELLPPIVREFVLRHARPDSSDQASSNG